MGYGVGAVAAVSAPPGQCTALGECRGTGSSSIPPVSCIFKVSLSTLAVKSECDR